MKNIRIFLSEKFQFLEVNFSMYLNRRVFVMTVFFFLLLFFFFFLISSHHIFVETSEKKILFRWSPLVLCRITRNTHLGLVKAGLNSGILLYTIFSRPSVVATQ